MSTSDFTKFYGVNDIGSGLFTTELHTNLKFFLDWCLLNTNAFYTVTIPSSGLYGGSNHVLRMQSNENFSDGQVWQGFRQDWVWETGLDHSNISPIRVSGVHVDGTYYPTSSTTGTYAHIVDYPNGRVIFNSAISTGSAVTAAFSYKVYQVTDDSVSWFKYGQYMSYRSDDAHFSQTASGDWNIPAGQRLQLPAIVTEIVPTRYTKPYELGHLAKWTYQDVLFHIFAENEWQRDQIIDILSLQNDRGMVLFNVNQAAKDGFLPLDVSGSPVSSGKMYPALLNDYDGKKCWWTNTRTQDMGDISPRLFGAIVRTTMETILP